MLQELDGSDIKKYRVLIIDDSPVTLTPAVNFLEEIGFIVWVAPDGESGLVQARLTHPNLILLDIVMPGIDGFETCTRLKQDPLTRDIPVIFMTALSSVEDKVKGFQVGAVDYVTKPIQREELRARMLTHLRIQGLAQQLQKQNQVLKNQAIELDQARKKVEIANQELQRLASLDSLTQVANRRRFDEVLNLEWKRLAREKAPLGLILCDLDYFKLYNDHYGHQAGDICLLQIAQAIDRVVRRSTDLVARYGGEELVIVLPNTSEAGAISIAQAIQQEIKQLRIPHLGSHVSKYVTISMGISVLVPIFDLGSGFLVAAADMALYAAKKQGRDQFCLYNQPFRPPLHFS